MRTVILLLSVIALSYANTCYFNGTDVATTCVAVNPACSWTNVNLWTNCGTPNGTYPGTGDTAYVISGNTSFTLIMDLPVTVAAIIMQGPGNLATLFVNNTLNSGTIDINNGIFQVNQDVTISSNTTVSVGTGASILMNSDITWAAGSTGFISVEAGATLTIPNNGAVATNQNIMNQGTMNFGTPSTLTLNSGAQISSNGTMSISGGANIVGSTGSILFSDVNGVVALVPSTSNDVVTLAVPTKIRSALSFANVTLTVQNSFFVENITVEIGAILNIQVDDASVPAFSVYNFQNDGTVQWTNGEVFQVTTNSGIFTNNGVFTINLVNATATLACNQTTMENFGTFTVSSTANIDGNFMSGNNGVVTLNAITNFFGYNHTFSDVTFDGVSVSGTGNAIFKSDVYFYAGLYSVQSTILGTFNIAHNDTKTLSYNVNATHMNISTAVELTVPFTNNADNYINGDGGSFMPVGNDSTTYPTFVNNGYIFGSITFDRINLTNNYVIGNDDTATVLKMVDSYLTLANSSSLTLGLYDQNVSPVQVSKSGRNMGGNPGAFLNGGLLIVLLEGFHPQNGNMTIFSSSGIAPITGNFTSANITAVENANEYNCDYNNTAINYATTEIILEFQNCEDLPETSSGPSKTTIIIIVVVVVAVVLIAAIVGVVLYRRRNAAHHPSEKQRLI